MTAQACYPIVVSYTEPEYSREEVNEAGRLLIDPKRWDDLGDIEHMFGVINNWRAAHNFPLNTIHVTLRQRSRKIDPEAVTAQRLKRLSSIRSKLRREENMKFSQMQDVGGCRAVLRDMESLRELLEKYRESNAKNPKGRSEFLHSKDYIASPKADGYRSVHLIYRYRTTSPRRKVYEGLKIEIQVRTKLQHAWATALETVGTFTGQALKWRGGQADWHRFFALMGSALALREGTPPVPNTPDDANDLFDELRHAADALNVENVLTAWRQALNTLPAKGATHASAFLLFLDPAAEEMQVTGYTSDEMAKASDDYLAMEKSLSEDLNAQAVLVSVDSVAALKAAYPNYFVDAEVFLDALRQAIA